jgi:hypothetical protein
LKSDVFKAVVRFDRFYTLLNQALPPHFQSRNVRPAKETPPEEELVPLDAFGFIKLKA